MAQSRSRTLRVVTADPFNAETPLERQVGTITPIVRHFVRSHFAVPTPPERVIVEGLVRERLSLGVDDLRAMPARSLVVTLECAGNGRAFLDPPAPGEQWRLGAVGTAEWTGVPLREVLRHADVLPAARDVVFRGADEGTVKDIGRRIAFERSLSVEEALGGDALVAYAMNGEPLTREHGAPARLVVPGAYGMASVKWLAAIVAAQRPFDGFFQVDRYVVDGAPLPRVAPRAVVVSPAEGARLRPGRLTVRGYAWSGGAPVDSVQVSLDGGATWRDAVLADALSPYAWREWSLAWDPPAGAATILARAVTSTGETQASADVRNALGYLNNAARPVRVTIA
ncbi:MAG TPA: sulfite oxidase [Candidatus Limnocylindria bacterium]|nr:sulfite oxidase [Candidatus Limnocylindria bacterium]